MSTTSEATEKQRTAALAYYYQHREERLRYRKSWKQQNREKVLLEKKRYRERHRETLAQKARDRTRQHSQFLTEEQKQARKKHKREWYRSYYRENKTRLSKANRPHLLRRKYGLTEDEYHVILKKQGGVCAICGAESTIYIDRETRLAVDHCHKTGKVRGLLCSRCNLAISFFNDSPTVLARARRYLLKHGA
jgi:hypothetical protein